MPTKKSTVISIRLNPAVPEDAQVLKVIEDLQERGFTTRQIVTDAILRAKGHTPEMYHNAGDKVTRPILEGLLSDFAQEIIDGLRTSGISETQTESSPFGDNDDDYARNLAEGFLARKKRGQG